MSIAPCWCANGKGAELGRWIDRLDGFLGRLIFRVVGLLCGIIALACGYAAWWHIEHWEADGSWLPAVLFGLATIGAASVIPFCFSRNRSLVEALDAMEDSVADQPRRH
jgi:hypothetical protein